MKTTNPDASALVIPFGKHKGATVAELLVKDPTYAAWVSNQGWVAERFAELHAAILARGAGTDDSPEHNAIQVRFLEPEFRLACLTLAYPDVLEKAKRARLSDLTRGHINKIQSLDDDLIRARRIALEDIYIDKDGSPSIYGINRRADADKDIKEIPGKIAALNIEIKRITAYPIYIATSVMFEQKGVDVLIRWNATDSISEIPSYSEILSAEIKPTMGDDFPAVMRQMGRLGVYVLVVGEYTGTSVPPTQLRQMFAANGCVVISVRAIEAEVARQAAKPLLLCAP